MRAVDGQGRLFGRFNVVDAALGALLLLLVPLGYGTYLLFRPATPLIESVAPSIITREEERISVGGRLVAKFKVTGSGFTPMLRARIGNADALAFVFENPSSADVLVGPVGPGPHDLVLVDGVQEVARAHGAIVIQPDAAATSIVASGWLVGLDEETTQGLTIGTALPQGSPAFRVTALGPLVPGFRQVVLAGSTIEIATPGTQARKAVLSLQCHAALTPNPCALGERVEYRTRPVTISLPGPRRPVHFEIDEIFPSTAPIRATLRVRLPVSGLAIKTGDRDDLLDERSATVTGFTGDTVTLDAGLDRLHDGWRYRGQRVLPGSTIVLTTDRYEARGVLYSFELKAPQP